MRRSSGKIAAPRAASDRRTRTRSPVLRLCRCDNRRSLSSFSMKRSITTLHAPIKAHPQNGYRKGDQKDAMDSPIWTGSISYCPKTCRAQLLGLLLVAPFRPTDPRFAISNRRLAITSDDSRAGGPAGWNPNQRGKTPMDCSPVQLNRPCMTTCIGPVHVLVLL